MNLFTGFNLVLRGGGLFLEDDPVLEFEYIGNRIVADIRPESRDGVVDFRDFAVLSEAWLTNSESSNWNPKADMAPLSSPEGIIDFLDLAVFAEYWLNTAIPDQ